MLNTLQTTQAQAAIRRLGALSPLDADAITALERAIGTATFTRSRTELLVEGEPIGRPLLIVDGWAARVRTLVDGRRQFLSFLLPGDLVGMCHQDRPLAVSTIVAITDVRTCDAPDGARHPALGRAYAVSGAMEEAFLLAQITRLGRLSALERLGDVMLELLERLTMCGRSRDNMFDMPLTQEQLSDVLGLTSVHINRMIQQARQAGWLHWRAKRVTIEDPAALARQIGRVPIKVQAPA